MATSRPSPSDCLRRVTNTVFHSIRKCKDKELATQISAPTEPTTSIKRPPPFERSITGQEPVRERRDSCTIDECIEKPQPAYIARKRSQPDEAPITIRPSLADLKIVTRLAEERAAKKDATLERKPSAVQRKQNKCSVCTTLGTICDEAEPCGYCHLMGREQRCSYPQPLGPPPIIRLIPPTPDSSPVYVGYGCWEAVRSSRFDGHPTGCTDTG